MQKTAGAGGEESPVKSHQSSGFTVKAREGLYADWPSVSCGGGLAGEKLEADGPEKWTEGANRQFLGR